MGVVVLQTTIGVPRVKTITAPRQSLAEQINSVEGKYTELIRKVRAQQAGQQLAVHATRWAAAGRACETQLVVDATGCAAGLAQDPHCVRRPYRYTGIPQ